jgi:phosphoglycerate kinase
VGAFQAEIAKAKTIIWNGPMGVFEKPPFDKGTVALAKAVAGSGAVSVVGGGDSEKAIKSAGVSDRITHISTGGGASLEFLSGIELPGVAALTDK